MKFSRVLFLLVICAAMLGPMGCAQRPVALSTPGSGSNVDAKTGKTYQDLIVGYAQIGAESEWRAANTISIKETAEHLGVELRFLDAQQKQENQIEAVRKLIIQKVDVIGISPIVETGWDEVFQEAKDAGIPIILVDRRATVPDNLYVSYLGSDFLEEGRKAARVMATLVNGKANIVELVGTIGSAPANDRYTGFREILKNYPGMQIIDSQSGDFTRARGKEVMVTFLQKYGKNITAVYAHNDDMALGAIEAVKARGLSGIAIIGFDALPEALAQVRDGGMTATIEQFPGKQSSMGVQTLVKFLKDGTKPDPKIILLTPQAVTKDNLNIAERLNEVK